MKRYNTRKRVTILSAIILSASLAPMKSFAEEEIESEPELIEETVQEEAIEEETVEEETEAVTDEETFAQEENAESQHIICLCFIDNPSVISSHNFQATIFHRAELISSRSKRTTQIDMSCPFY